MIKLEEICGYLPYNPLIIYPGTHGMKIKATLTGILERLTIWETTYAKKRNKCYGDLLSYYDGKERGHNTYIDNVRLILRPLLDLTREIEHNGVKFVPIVELAKIEKMLEPISFDLMQDLLQGVRGVCAKDRFGNQWLMYDFKGVFSMWHKPHKETEHKPTLLNNQLQLFQKLYEWHFDVYGLIERGNAIDINTLNL